MKILIYADDVLGIHYATNLEIVEKHLHQGDEVHLLVCHGALQSCPSNNNHDRKICVLCRSKLRVGLSASVMERATIHILDLENYLDSVTIPEFDSIDEVKAFSIDGINHGMEAASSVISAIRDPKPDMQDRRLLVRGNLLTSVALYHAALDLIDRVEPDLCYVLNGRRSSQMPVIRALRKKKVKFNTFEVGHNWQKYILIEGTYFHDLENKKREIEKYWTDSVPQTEKVQIACKFYNDRRFGSGDEYPEALFKRNQRKGRLPEGLNPACRNIAIFNSSEDEFAAVEGYDNPVYKNQIEGLKEILSSPEVDKSIRFYLRVHPNLGGVRNFQTKAIEELRADNLVIVQANEDIDSYALMENSEKVLTFGSAMSIESAYAGKPSILVGREPYEDLGACYTPRSHAETVALINDPKLPCLSNVGALKYGYYMVARDVSYQYFDPKTKTFHGKALAPSAMVKRAIRLLQVGPLAYLNNRRRVIPNFIKRHLLQELR